VLHAFVAGLCLLAGVIATQDARTASAPACANDARILVKPRECVSLEILNDLHARLGIEVLRTFPRIGNLQILKLPLLADVQAIIAAYQNSGLVAYAEPDYVVNLLMEPDDPSYWNGDLWNFRNVGQYGGVSDADIHALAGWDIRTSASNIVVAVIDTGVRYTHEDLAANMWVNSGETGVDDQGRDKATNGVDDDGDGYVDDVHGINTLLNNGDPNDDYGHGSHVAGTIGAVGNNNVGVAGVCWRVQLMACEFIDSQGDGSISDAITCIDYARSKGAKIINASWGSYSFTSAALRDAINSIRDAGIIFVAACGNNANDNDANSLYPASYGYDNVIAVAATDRSDALAFFSNFGASTVHIAAPGSPVFSCWNGSDSDYRYFDGTSMAAPHVAGACALVYAQYPNDTPHQIIKRVLSGVDQLPQLSGSCVTGGRLNLANALTVQPFPESTPSTVWVDDGLPAGAVPGTDDGDSWSGEPWNWVTNNPAPFAGAAAHQSGIISGVHRHYFENATNTLEIFPGDILFGYVYLDPDNPPREVMLEWNDGCWEHRAFWGENLITWGTYGTSNRRDMGELPPTGQWVRLEVPAGLLGLEGATLKGMSFMLVDGRATWDYAGRAGQ
jgi:subtilisin family serine protease